MELNLVRTVNLAEATFPVSIKIDNWDPIRLPWADPPYAVNIAPGAHHAIVKIGVGSAFSRPVRFDVADAETATLLIYGSGVGWWRTPQPRLVVHPGKPAPQRWPGPNRTRVVGALIVFVAALAAIASPLVTETSVGGFAVPFLALIGVIAGTSIIQSFVRARRLREASRMENLGA
ncbi:hypothetical protein EK0264_06265 [Epidermidibacterium keratini]|uniref:Uncharacterized protein n=1 Tax=Epidermidibacterium keratini TaxID=1891644 RepID=A0A7L4YL72_9ACTN|nr:hypothetical protein [Epidermidibacterium keratini]QHB99925.1 hypothetical protein EK0264_06265 [Epidermidibacterium keratini]